MQVDEVAQGEMVSPSENGVSEMTEGEVAAEVCDLL